jgi:hypothetical protein
MLEPEDSIELLMRYTTPSGYSFEIPDDWLDEAGVRDLHLNATAYPVAKPEAGVRGESIELALTDVLTSLENRPAFDTPGPFDRRRMVAVLEALRDGVAMPPVWVWPIEAPTDNKRHQLLQGHHRYHACVALGLANIPVLVVARDKPYVAPPAFPCGCRGNDKSCPCCAGTGKIEWP